MHLKQKILCLCYGLGTCGYNIAADLNARDFYSAPSGTQIGLLYLNYDRSTNFHGKNADNASLRSTSIAYRHIFYTDICGTLCTPQIIIPTVDLDIRPPGTSKSKHKTNLADIQLGGTLFTINQPENRLYSGLLTMIVAPTGSYQTYHPSTSIGKNRWEADFVYNITKGITDRLVLETNFEIQIYTKNNDFNGMSYHQKPVFRNQSFVSYSFTDKTYGALRFIYTEGGRGKLEGMKLSDSLYRNVQLGFKLSHQITPKDALMLSLSRDVKTHNTFQGSHVLLRLAHVY